MSVMDAAGKHAVQNPSVGAADTKLEVVVLPVGDVDRARAFYEGLGWRVDADFAHGDEWRAVQVTPPGSPCSVIFGKGFTSAAPGSLPGTFLVVEDLAAAREQLRGRGLEVSDIFHFEGGRIVAGTKGRTPGPDPDRRSYFSFASFQDPDGNTWMLQEVKSRFAGRGFSVDVPAMTTVLREAEEHHGAYEPTAPKHHWSEWYAAYVVARHQGRSPEQAAAEAKLHTERAAVPIAT